MQVAGIPSRMAKAVGALFMRDGAHSHASKREVLGAMKFDHRIPLVDEKGEQTKPAAIRTEAHQAARECYAVCDRMHTVDAIKIAIAMICRRRGVPVPTGATVAEGFARAVDPAWWNRQLRKEWLRRLEHTAIQLGLTHVSSGDPYISRESALFQARQNAANQKLLESRKATNDAGQSYTVAELAALGMSNKKLRRQELMTRIRGFEEIAAECKHIGMFWTITCPSEFHSVGGTNENYSGATPRDAQAYLVHAWALMRSCLARQGLKMYGFRIAEPHTDGCPHWHMLLFVAPTAQPADWHAPLVTPYIQRTSEQAATRIRRVITMYARYHSPHERGAKENRVKLVRIEAGKGAAAGYIAKYIGKNIDGYGVGDHKTFENGATYTIETDLVGTQELTASGRVTYWSQVWGIRQFQQIGGAPVGVWRELRRIKEEAVRAAPAVIRAAHAACQKFDHQDPAKVVQADFAAYVMAQGGPVVGRGAAIKIAGREVEIVGRYATYTAEKPVGVYLAAQPEAVYEGVHYTWVISDADRRGGVAFDLPRTGVNNCTDMAEPKPEKKFFRSVIAAKWNGGDGSGASGWSIEKDFARVEQYRLNRKGGAELRRKAHLEELRRKYG
jgi:hypothetical protein